jgi:hypothetical protein
MSSRMQTSCRIAVKQLDMSAEAPTQSPHRLLVVFVIFLEIGGECQKQYHIAYSLIAPFILAC